MTSLLAKPEKISKLFTADTKNVRRDPTLLFAIILALLPTFIILVWSEQINTGIQSSLGVANIIGYAMPVIITLPAFLMGWIAGFLFLEDRDESTLIAIDTTPLGKSGFIAYRSGATMIITALITIANLNLFMPDLSWLQIIGVTVLVSLASIISALILPAIARNKVEGLALTKLTNIGAIVPLAALFPSPLRYIAGIIPTFWVGEAMQIAPLPFMPAWLAIAIGLVESIAILVLLRHLFNKRVG